MSRDLEEIRAMCSSLLDRLDTLARQEQKGEIDVETEAFNAVALETGAELAAEGESEEDTENGNDMIMNTDPEMEQEAELVSLAGVKSGVGVTHHSILIASFLQNAGISVAVADFSGNIGLEGCEIPYYSAADEQLLDQIAYQYQIILLDLGDFEKCNRSLFRRSNKRIVFAGYKLWEREALNKIFATIPEDEVKRYLYVFNHVKDSERVIVMDGMQPIEKVYFAGITEDPFMDYKDSVAEKLFPEYATIEKKRKGLLRRK